MKYIQKLKKNNSFYYVLGISKKNADGTFTNLSTYISKVEFDFLFQSGLFYIKDFKDFDKE